MVLPEKYHPVVARWLRNSGDDRLPYLEGSVLRARRTASATTGIPVLKGTRKLDARWNQILREKFVSLDER